MAWFTVAMTFSFINSAMMVKGRCFKASARARTTIGGLSVMTCASVGREILGVWDWAGRGGGCCC